MTRTFNGRHAIGTAMTFIRFVLVCGVLLSFAPLHASAQSASPAPFGDPPMTALIGSWSCDGYFPSNGRKIGSTMRIDADLNGTALVKHQDDRPELGMYHSLEVWTRDPKAGTYISTIFDSSGGVRRFTSSGWVGNTLTWSIDPGASLPQQFVYIRNGNGTIQLDWRRARDGKTFTVGDTLTCTKRAP